ncbi:MAG: NTP transferase domain-containing protein, partial [Clostridia bacterium]|nr:NTP transferase domain-containing protein [Clostridia bacterium]
MKAILLCGGEGTRLRPLTCRTPKPMVRIFDRPILWHVLQWLRAHGVTEAAVTLRYRPHVLRDYFGDGHEAGISLTYFTESDPLGTAGAVRACRDFIGDEDVIIASGDGICDLDLSAALQFHRDRKAEATMLLYSHPEPLSYGIVRTDVRDRIIGFAEKPAWGEVFTDRVNTGIYILSPSAVDRIPADTPFDFSGDLFPAMVAEQAALCGCALPGYWRDLGDPGAYRACIRDALEGKVDLARPAEPANLPEGVSVTGPCYISAKARLASPCEIGPYTVLQEGTSLGVGSRVTESVISGTLGTRAEAEGTILDRGALLGPSARAERDSVIGCGANIGTAAEIAAGVCIWPEVTVEPGCRVTSSVFSGGRWLPRITSEGFSGSLGYEMTPDLFLRLGAVLCPENGRLLLAGGPEWAISALAAGAASVGTEVYSADCPFAAVTSMTARLYGTTLSGHLSFSENALTLSLFDGEGLPLSGRELHRIQSRLAAGPMPEAVRSGNSCHTVTGTAELYYALAARAFPCRGIRAWAEEGSPARQALELAGAELDPAAPRFDLSSDGFSFSFRDEDGCDADSAHAITILLSALCLSGERRRIALLPDAPAAPEAVAARRNIPALRLGRDGDAAPLLARSPEFFHGIHGMLCLCGLLSRHSLSLSALRRSLPDFTAAERDIPVPEGRAAAMRHLSESFPEAEIRNGVHIRNARGTAILRPDAETEALHLHAESAQAEFADEIAAEIERSLHSRQDEA